MTRTHALLLLALLCPACGAGTGGPPPFRHGEFYRALQRCAGDFVITDEGEWVEDFDDGAFYGPAFYAWAGETDDDDACRALARRSAARNLEVVRQADLVNGDVNLIAMAALGLIEYIGATGDREGLGDLDTLIGDMNDLVAAMGNYIPPEMVPGYAMETYGPVAINGLMGLIGLQRAAVIGPQGTDDDVAFTRELLAELRQRHFEDGVYAFGADREGLFLYPNITMIILAARLYQLTGVTSYRDHALAIHAGIQPLKVTADSGLAGPGRYRSPYSAEHMGATTDDYSTLSSQNYTMLALMLLYQITGEERFLEECDPILDFTRDLLQGDSCASDLIYYECDPACEGELACLKGRCFPDACHCGVLHHWMDGRLAVATDPEFFCSGCNLQLLYIMWYRQHGLEPVD